MARAPLDPEITAISGRNGDVVYSVRGGTTYVRPFVPPRDPKTIGQMQSRTRLQMANEAWLTLKDAQIAAWEAWGAAHPKRDAFYGTFRTLTAQSAFLSLALKYLHVHPNGTPPALPPAAEFTEPGISVTAAGTNSAIVWDAAGTVPAGVVCELLTCPVKTLRVPATTEKFRTVLFTTFTGNGGQVVTECAAGLCAPAFRWASPITGQTGEWHALPVVLVG